jgi:hypothetical protein
MSRFEAPEIAVDKNIAALCSTKKTNGTTYIFYYTPDTVIAFLTGADVSSYSEQKVKVKDANGNKNTVTGSNSPLATTTWNDEIRLYYIDSNQLINELCLGSDGTWFCGQLTDKNYKASSDSGLYATGNALDGTDSGNITVLFMDSNNHDKLTQATIDIKTRVWATTVIDN